MTINWDRLDAGNPNAPPVTSKKAALRAAARAKEREDLEKGKIPKLKPVNGETPVVEEDPPEPEQEVVFTHQDLLDLNQRQRIGGRKTLKALRRLRRKLNRRSKKASKRTTHAGRGRHH